MSLGALLGKVLFTPPLDNFKNYKDMFVRVRGGDRTYVVIFGGNGDYCFPLHLIDDHVAIHDFNHDYLTITYRGVIEVLETFVIMSF